MRLSDIMSVEVETISPSATVQEAREQMRRAEVRHLVVLEGEGIAGVVSEHDLRRADADAPVRGVMSAPVVTATPLTTVRQAANLMRGNRVTCLPLLDPRERLAGIVTVADVLDLIGKGVTREQVDDRRHRAFVPGR